MSLKERLAADFKDALKSKDEVRKNVVNMARAAIKQYEVDNRKELDEEGVIEILSKQVKMRRDALQDFEKAERSDLLDVYKAEIKILETYLPEQLSLEEVKAIVQETVQSLGLPLEKKSMGQIMKAVMPKVKGKADGAVVKSAVESLLE